MGQGWPGIVGADKIRLSRADIVERFESLRGLFNGETAPTDPAPSQPWYKPSTKELFIWDADLEEWELLVKPSVGGMPGYVTPESYGAVGVLPGLPANDCKTAFLDAIATGLRVQGNPSLVYGINGTMTICTSGNSAWLARCTFEQLNPNDSARRTLYASGGVQVVLEDVTINRAGDGNGGSLTDAAGIWLANVTRVFLDRVEVYGDDKGTGVMCANCSNVSGRDIYVHDIKGGSSAHATITDDVVSGLSIFGCDRVYLENPRVANLTTEWSGQTEWARWTRGITFGQGSDGARRVTIVAPMVDGTDEAIDVTGGGNVRYGCIIGGYSKDALTYGIKFANNPQFWTVHGFMAEGSGLHNCVISGNAALSPQTSKIIFNACIFLAVGRVSSYWRDQGQENCGAKILNTATTDWPREVLFKDCFFEGAGGQMKYAIYNQATIGGQGEQWIEQDGCHVANLISGGRAFFGLHQGFAERRRSAALACASGSWVDLDFDTSGLKEGMASASAGSNIIRCMRGGIYQISASILWDFVAGGSRMARLVRQRTGEGGFTEVPGTYQRVPPLGAGQMGVPFSALVEANAGTQLKLQIQQDSGSSANAYGTAVIALVQKGTTFS